MVAPTRPNPYEPGNLIWVSTPPLERAAKLFPKWIGLFRVLRVSNPHHVVYTSSAGMCTMHIHHTKPAEPHYATAASQPLGYLPSVFTHKSVARDQARGASRVTTLCLTNPLPPMGVLQDGSLIHQSELSSVWPSSSTWPSSRAFPRTRT